MNLRKFGILTMTFSLLTLGGVHAGEIARESEDRSSGKSGGGMTGMMVGAIGGPIGALIGAGVGALVGGSAQDAAKGEVKTLRSPGRSFAAGDQVEIRGNRPHLKTAGKSAALAEADSLPRSVH